MRVQATSVCLWLALLLPSVGLRAAPEDAGKDKVKDEKWIVVTGKSSGRFVWTAFSLPEREPVASGSAPSPGQTFQIDPIWGLLLDLGIPLVTDDVVSCDLQRQAIPSEMQPIEFLHYLTKHFHNSAGNSDFELQVDGPLWALWVQKADPLYLDKPLALSLKSKTKTGLSRMVRLSNLVGQNVTQLLQATKEYSVVRCN
jgi:hypothetical protein